MFLKFSRTDNYPLRIPLVFKIILSWAYGISKRSECLNFLKKTEFSSQVQNMFGHYTRGEYEARSIKIVISGSDKMLKITIREKTFSEISVFQFPKNFHFKKKAKAWIARKVSKRKQFMQRSKTLWFWWFLGSKFLNAKGEFDVADR